MNRYFGLHTLEGEWHALLPRYLLLSDSIQGARVLDIGCGNGLGASLLRELGASAVDAIDHRPAVLELARMKHAKEGLDFHVMLWEELDFAEDTFDVILCLDPSSPVTDPNLLREVRRVLRPGGRYICAIERKNVQGFESLLPRYGYADAAERVDINQSNSRVPQIGEISRHFNRLHTIVQRPHAGFVFDVIENAEGQDSPPANGEERRGGEEEVLKIERDGDELLPERWIHVDKSFCTNESEMASVELWFCGDENLQVPKLREIRLPYYSLVKRLRQMMGDLQAKQRSSLGHAPSEVFDELLEAGSEQTETFEDTKQTGEIFLTSLDDQVTQVRPRPTPPPRETVRPSLQLEQLDAHLAELDALHRRIKTDFDRLFFETRATLDARESHLDETLSHLTRSQAKDREIERLEARVAQLERELSLARQAPPRDQRLERQTTREFVRPEGLLTPPNELTPEQEEALLTASDAAPVELASEPSHDEEQIAIDELAREIREASEASEVSEVSQASEASEPSEESEVSVESADDRDEDSASESE